MGGLRALLSFELNQFQFISGVILYKAYIAVLKRVKGGNKQLKYIYYSLLSLLQSPPFLKHRNFTCFLYQQLQGKKTWKTCFEILRWRNLTCIYSFSLHLVIIYSYQIGCKLLIGNLISPSRSAGSCLLYVIMIMILLKIVESSRLMLPLAITIYVYKVVQRKERRANQREVTGVDLIINSSILKPPVCHDGYCTREFYHVSSKRKSIPKKKDEF